MSSMGSNPISSLLPEDIENKLSNALEEKEKKINKYLAIFENMKDVIK